MRPDPGSVRRAAATALTVGVAALGLAACAVGSALLPPIRSDPPTVAAAPGAPITATAMPLRVVGDVHRDLVSIQDDFVDRLR